MEALALAEHISKLAAAVYYLAAVVTAFAAALIILLSIIAVQTYRGEKS
jgi:hypothetical protein